MAAVLGGVVIGGSIGLLVDKFILKKKRSGSEMELDQGAQSFERRNHEESFPQKTSPPHTAHSVLAAAEYVDSDMTLRTTLEHFGRFYHVDPESFYTLVGSTNALIRLFTTVSDPRTPLNMTDSARAYEIQTMAMTSATNIREKVRKHYENATNMMHDISQNIRDLEQKLDDIVHNIRLTVNEKMGDSARRGELTM